MLTDDTAQEDSLFEDDTSDDRPLYSPELLMRSQYHSHVVSESLVSEDTKVYLEIFDLKDDPVFCFVDLHDPQAPVQRVPFHLLSVLHNLNEMIPLKGEQESLLEKFRLQVNLEQRKMHIDLFADCLSLEPEFWNAVYQKSDSYHISRDGIPFMQWKSSAQFGPYAGWSLMLTSVGMSQELGFAVYDDREGIARLISSMNDREKLYTLLALTNPVESRKLRARMTLHSYLMKGLLDGVISTPDFKALLIENGLSSINENSAAFSGKVSPIQGSINIDEIVIGFKIKSPTISSLLVKNGLAPTPAGDEDAQAIQWDAWESANQEIYEKTARQWEDTFRGVCKTLGYNLIAPMYPSSYDYWVTPLFQEQLLDVAESVYLTPEENLLREIFGSQDDYNF